ncbi:hypothetical protein M1512_03295 [Patescibacteria group bacterium]|nr:hypothetical protein [Patescibacteria group bacterium]
MTTKTELNRKTSHKIPTIWLVFAPLIIILIGYVFLIVGASNSTLSSYNVRGNASLQAILTAQSSQSIKYKASGVAIVSSSVNSISPSIQFNTTTVSNKNTTHLNSMGVVGLMLIIVGFIAAVLATFWWFFRFAKAVNEYTYGKMSTAVAFLTLWLVHFIGVALIQDSFNDLIDSQQQPVTQL